MSFLLDTCVLSELVKAEINIGVRNWASSVAENSLFISVITLGEIEKGFLILPQSRKRAELVNWFGIFNERFKDRTLLIDKEVIHLWAEIISQNRHVGRVLPVVNSLIAATALVHNLKIVTRNETDFDHSGLSVVNPWT